MTISKLHTDLTETIQMKYFGKSRKVRIIKEYLVWTEKETIFIINLTTNHYNKDTSSTNAYTKKVWRAIYPLRKAKNSEKNLSLYEQHQVGDMHNAKNTSKGISTKKYAST